MSHNQTNSIYQKIKESILSGEYKPSQPLNENDLVNQFNASRVTIKKVLLMLESEGLVENPANRSARVRTFDMDEIEQHLQVRILLEGYCAQVTAPIIPDGTIEVMENTLEVMNDLYTAGDYLGYSTKNVYFHKCIYDACPNKVATEYIWNIRNKISRYNFKTILVPGRIKDSFQEHEDILEAYRRHDPELAKKATIKHVSNLLNTLKTNYNMLSL